MRLQRLKVIVRHCTGLQRAVPCYAEHGPLSIGKQGRRLEFENSINFLRIDTQLAGTIARVGSAVGASLRATADDADQSLEAGINVACLQQK